MREKFGRKLRDTRDYSFDFTPEFSVETYLDHQGQRFVERFDANCYLYITKAMDYYDVAKDYGSLENAFNKTNARFLVISFSSDWLFTPAQSEELVDALSSIGKDVSYFNIESNYGHDAFLIESDTLGPVLDSFLATTYRQGAACESCQSDLAAPPADRSGLRIDYDLIESNITAGSRVLDIGCGDGELLTRLKNDKNIICRGIEYDINNAMKCLERGLAVLHRDVERGLAMYPDKSFDYVLLSQTLQTLKDPKKVFLELHRVGRKVVVSFPNFAHYSCRTHIIFRGKSPVTNLLPFKWYDSPNIHFFSLRDFEDFCKELDIRIETKIPLGRSKKSPVPILPNLLALQAVYVTSKNGTT